MYDETIGKLTGVAKKKLGVLNESRFKYLVSSAFAGAFIGVGILLAFNDCRWQSSYKDIDGCIILSSLEFGNIHRHRPVYR